MCGIVPLLSYCLVTFGLSWTSNAEARKAVFEDISYDQGKGDGSMHGIFHKIFYQCGLEEGCKFVAKSMKSSEYTTIFDEKDLPKDRKNFKIWQKRMIKEQSNEGEELFFSFGMILSG